MQEVPDRSYSSNHNINSFGRHRSYISKNETISEEHPEKDFKDRAEATRANGRPIQPRQKDYLVDEVGKVSPDRFEWLLYLQIPNKLNGQLYLPTVIKFRSLQDDLVNNERWKSKNKLIQQSMLPRLMEKPSRLIESLSNDLNNELARVSQRIEDGDNQNVILRNRTGKTQWRLPSTSVKSMLNNPFFDLLKPINIADVLRYVDQETNFLDHFEHVLPVQ